MQKVKRFFLLAVCGVSFVWISCSDSNAKDESQTDDDSCKTDWQPVSDMAKIAKALSEKLECPLFLELPEGEFEGTIELPSNVHLRGAGKDKTSLVAPDGSSASAVITLSPDESGDVSLSRLKVESSSMTAITASGNGLVRMSDFSVNLNGSMNNGGVGVRLEGLADFVISNASISGNVNEDNSGGINVSNLSDYALEGIVIDSCAKGELHGVGVLGFAWSGARLGNGGAFVWDSEGSDSEIDTVTRVGLLVGEEVNLTIDDLSIGHVFEGGFNDSGFGVVVLDGSLTASGLEVSNTGYVGVFADNSSMTLDTISISEARIGVWSQKQDGVDDDISLVISGMDIHDVRGIGIGVHSIGTIDVQGGEISTITEIALPDEGGSYGPMGDGVQVLGMSDDITIANVSITDSERAGIVIDPVPDSDLANVDVDADFSGTSISGDGSRGFVVQKGETEDVPERSAQLQINDENAPADPIPVKNRMDLELNQK